LVLVDPRFVLMHADALAALKRRAHVAESPAGLIATYRRLLADGDFSRVGAADRLISPRLGTPSRRWPVRHPGAEGDLAAGSAHLRSFRNMSRESVGAARRGSALLRRA